MERVKARPVSLGPRGLAATLLTMAFALAFVAPAQAEDLAAHTAPVATLAETATAVEATIADPLPVAVSTQDVANTPPETPAVTTGASPGPAALGPAPSVDTTAVTTAVTTVNTAVDTLANTALDAPVDLPVQARPVASPVVKTVVKTVVNVADSAAPARRAFAPEDAPSALPPAPSAKAAPAVLPSEESPARHLEAPAALEPSEALVTRSDVSIVPASPARTFVSVPTRVTGGDLGAVNGYFAPTVDPRLAQPVKATAGERADTRPQGPASPPLPGVPPVPAAAASPPALLAYDNLAILLAVLALLYPGLSRRARDRPDRATVTLLSLSLKCPG